MSSDSRRTCSFTVERPEDKRLLRAYAKSRGFSRLSEFLRVAVYGHITRGAPRSNVPIDTEIRDMITGKKTAGVDVTIIPPPFDVVDHI